MHQVITFLGKYLKRTDYLWQDRVYSGEVFAKALHQFLDFDRMLVFTTTEARETTWPVLAALGDQRIVQIPIDTGISREEMWRMFDAVIEQIDRGDHVTFDITHGLRSIQFLAFLFAAYLKSAKEVTIRAIYYGAYELGNQDKGNPAPIIDLSEFVSMLDWISAVNEFLYTGNARYLAEQLNKRDNPDLQPLSDNVSEISLGLELLRPRDVTQAAQILPTHLNLVRTSLPRPFGVVVGPLENAYARFGVSDESPWSHLSSQLEMINWYLEKQQYVHTLSMAREWVVSLLCVHYGEDLWDKDSRDEIELLLSGGQRKDEHGKIIKESRHLDSWRKDKRRKIINQLWQGREITLANLRNDVLHAGFRKNPGKAEVVIRQTRKVVELLNGLTEAWPELHTKNLTGDSK